MLSLKIVDTDINVRQNRPIYIYYPKNKYKKTELKCGVSINDLHWLVVRCRYRSMYRFRRLHRRLLQPDVNHKREMLMLHGHNW